MKLIKKLFNTKIDKGSSPYDIFHKRNNSRSQLYAQLGSALQKNLCCIFCFDKEYFQRFHHQFFCFSVQRQNFVDDLTGPEFTLIFSYGQKPMSTRRADIHLI